MANEATASTHYVAANPGWSVIGQCGSGNDLELFTHPIIAWRISEHKDQNGSQYVVVDPVVCDGWSAKESFAVLQPDGHVQQPGGDSWNSQDDYLAYLKEEQAQWPATISR